MADEEHEIEEEEEVIEDLRRSAWDDDDDDDVAGSPPADEPPEDGELEDDEDDESEDGEPEGEKEADKPEEDESPLEKRERELEEARTELARQKADDERQKASESKLKMDDGGLEKLKERFDLSGLTFPNPVEDGKTMTFSEVKGEYPGIAEVVETLVGLAVKDSDTKLEAVNQQMEEMRMRNDVLRAHPDADDVFEDKEFNGWVDKQSDSIRTLLDYGSAKDVNLVLSEFKKTITPPEPVKPKAKPKASQRAPGKKKSIVAPKAPNSQAFSRKSAWEDDE